MSKIEGACRCGKATFGANVEPDFVGICHCTNCQKETGSAFSVAIGVPTAALTVNGTLKTFTAKGDSGKSTSRRFCPDCGTGLVFEAEVLPGVSMVCAGNLDDPSWVKPTVEIFCDSKQPWVSLGGGMQQFPKMPPD